MRMIGLAGGGRGESRGAQDIRGERGIPLINFLCSFLVPLLVALVLPHKEAVESKRPER
jgi:hypothetical protein